MAPKTANGLRQTHRTKLSKRQEGNGTLHTVIGVLVTGRRVDKSIKVGKPLFCRLVLKFRSGGWWLRCRHGECRANRHRFDSPLPNS